MAETTPTTPPAPQPGTPEYDAAMAAVGKGMNARPDFKPENIPANKPQRPEHIPEKFWDGEKGEVRVEDLAKSYAELERTRGAAKPDPATLKIPEAKEGDDPAKAAAAAAGLDWDVLGAKMLGEKGLEDTDFAALAKVGLPREIVENYVALAKESGARQTELAVAHVGGEEKMNALLEWAGKSLSEAEKVEYNKMLGNRNQWKVALDTLMAKQAGAVKTAGEPTLVNGGGRPNSSPEVGYASREEMVKDMSSPQYFSDPAFRQRVAAKVAAGLRAAG
jgi:hypothetical protein